MWFLPSCLERGWEIITIGFQHSNVWMWCIEPLCVLFTHESKKNMNFEYCIICLKSSPIRVLQIGCQWIWTPFPAASVRGVMAFIYLIFPTRVWGHDLFSHEFIPVVLLEKKSELNARSACLLNHRFTVIRLQKVSEIGRKVRKLDQSRDFFMPEFRDVTGTFCS